MLGLLETLKIKDPCLGLDLVQGKSNEGQTGFYTFWECTCDVVCVYVCVWERERMEQMT